MFCCGCPEYLAWKSVVDVYDKQGLREFTMKLQAIRAKKSKVTILQQQVKSAVTTLPKQLVDLI